MRNADDAIYGTRMTQIFMILYTGKTLSFCNLFLINHKNLRHPRSISADASG